MLRDLLPDTIAVVDTRAMEDDLVPEEAALVSRAVAARRRDFAAGRWCARRALAQLGWSGPVVLSGPEGEPLWPDGAVGSITHCEGYCAAAVARTTDLRGIGIDAEPNRALPPGVQRLVGSAEELGRLPDDATVHWPTVLFSAKEAVFKAWYPLTRRRIEFTDAEVAVDPGIGAFVGRFARPAPGLDSVAGRFVVTHDMILTAVRILG